MLKLRIDQVLLIISLIIFLVVQGCVSTRDKQKVEDKFEVSLVNVAPIPIRSASDSAVIEQQDRVLENLTASSYYVMDLDSAAILAEKNPDEKFFPASTTKMMTALVARKILNADDVITVDKDFSYNGHNMGLVVGERIRVKDLLAGLLIRSGNDAAYVLASQHPQGVDGFVSEMNSTASQLHLTNTNFTNPAGLDIELNVSTARDLAILAKELTKDELLYQLVGVKDEVVTNVEGTIKHVLANTNALLEVEDGVKGIKTGTTDLAKEVLITLIEKENRKIIIVLMGSQDRYLETKEIIDWIFNNYKWVGESYFESQIE